MVDGARPSGGGATADSSATTPGTSPPVLRKASLASQSSSSGGGGGGINANASAAQASSSLALLMREDQLLTKYNMHVNPGSASSGDGNSAPESGEEPSYAYAAALLLEDDASSSPWSSSGDARRPPTATATTAIRDHQQRAEDALGEVDRKLALVGSLAERVSRTSPEAVAGPLLRLHGHALAVEDEREREGGADGDDGDGGGSGAGGGGETAPTASYGSATGAATAAATLLATRERCDRLQRQGEVLEGVASRVETSLSRGLGRMEKATKRLSRVLQLSATLKMILRLQFEASKLEGFILDDMRDLTRAAASVAVIEGLLSKPEFKTGPHNRIDVVEAIRPQATKTAAAVRRAAAALLARQQEHNASNSTSNSSSTVIQLGATLQVYYHLGELPQAAWSAVNHALGSAERVCNEFFSPTTLTHLAETATTEAKLSAAGKKLSDATVQRALKNKLKEFRAQAATKWANGISDASLQVWNLQQVLSRKSDPVSRQVFLDVVSAAPVPERFRRDHQDLGTRTAPGGNANEARNRSDGASGGARGGSKDGAFSIFALFWEQLCQRMGERLKHILEYENGKFAPDISALYPAVRAAILQMLSSLKDTMQAAGAASSMMMNSLDEAAALSSSNALGVLGGSAALHDPFLKWSALIAAEEATGGASGDGGGAAKGGGGAVTFSADSWTVVKNNGDWTEEGGAGQPSSGAMGSTSTTTSMSVVFNSLEWQTLQGNHASQKGLFRLQMAFLEASRERLCAPLQYMFSENVTIDDTGNAISHLPLLPSKYDIQKFDSIIRQELAMADPREGGGDLSAVTMIAENVVLMVHTFCEQAENAVCNVGEEGCLHADGSPTEALVHDLKVTKIVHYMADCLRMAPEKVFVDPYRPAVTNQQEEASNVAMRALLPAREEIDNLVESLVLLPLCRALNRRVAVMMRRMHQEGAYLHGGGSLGTEDAGAPSFVQKYLAGLFDSLSATYLSKLPPPYSVVVGSKVSLFSVYNFVSNVSLIRPLDEDAKLHVTQDLADFELVLEQFMTQAGGNVESMALSEIGNGKPYAELRAVRQMLFWTGLDDAAKPATAVAKGLLREVWVRDVRPSTLFHYLVSFAPNMLSSPHHWKRVRVDEYVGTLVTLDGDVEEGEAGAWMTTMACCDSYQQRESAQSNLTGSGNQEGDPRIAAVLLALGPELLRRRRT